MATTLSKLISKYALILATMYVVVFAVGILIKKINLTESPENFILRTWGNWGVNVVLNAFTAVLVYLDIKKYSVRTKYVVLATILFRPVGVFAFLLFLALQETGANEEKQAPL